MITLEARTDDAAAGFAGSVPSLVDVVYAFVPVSRDENIINAVIAHVNSMSSEINKRWRIVFFGRETPVSSAVLTPATNPVPGHNWMATINL